MICAIVARYSDDDHDSSSVDNQVSMCRRMAASLGLTVPEHLIFRKDGVSGSLVRACPVLCHLLELARAGIIQAAIAKTQSRWHRNDDEFTPWLAEMSRLGVRVYAGKSLLNKPTETAREFKARKIESVENTAYRLQISEDVRQANVERALQGITNGAVCMGWRFNPETNLLTPDDPGTAEIVRDWYARAAAGTPLLRIAREADAKGLRGPNGGRIRHSLVRSVITNPRNKGWTMHRDQPVLDGGIVVPYAGGRLVDDATWAAAQPHGTRGRPAAYPFILAGKLFTSTRIVSADSSHYGKPVRYRGDFTRHRKPKYRSMDTSDPMHWGSSPVCSPTAASTIPAEALDRFVVEYLLDKLGDNEILMVDLPGGRAKHDSLRAEIALCSQALRRAAQARKTARKRLDNALDFGLAQEAAEQRQAYDAAGAECSRLSAECSRLELELADLSTPVSTPGRVNALAAAYKSGDMWVVRDLVQAILRHGWVDAQAGEHYVVHMLSFNDS